MRRPLLQQQWPKFKLDFTTAHQELRNTNTTVEKLGFSSVNTIVAQIVDQLRAEVPVESKIEPQIVTTTPSSLYVNLSTANAAQSASDTAIAYFMASMMASMEEIRAHLDELDEKRCDRNG